ncbi:MAG TPA: hypothetical protein VFG00_00460 [Acidothermaceae bacterium]|nr:hypothetical protein [Acidothermaceae bacterium]
MSAYDAIVNGGLTVAAWIITVVLLLGCAWWLGHRAGVLAGRRLAGRLFADAMIRQDEDESVLDPDAVMSLVAEVNRMDDQDAVAEMFARPNGNFLYDHERERWFA